MLNISYVFGIVKNVVHVDCKFNFGIVQPKNKTITNKAYESTQPVKMTSKKLTHKSRRKEKMKQRSFILFSVRADCLYCALGAHRVWLVKYIGSLTVKRFVHLHLSFTYYRTTR